MRKYRRIFILGSGFSKAVSSEMPVIKDLKEKLEAPERYGIQPAHFLDLIEYIRNLIRLSNNDEQLTSFESLCHLILSKPFYYNSDEEMRFHVLRSQLLRWIYTQIEEREPTVDRQYMGDVVKFLEYCSHPPFSSGEGESLIISFNYDLLLERLIKSESCRIRRMDHSVNLNSYSSAPADVSGQAGELVFEYIKLHGSFDWYLAPSASNIDISNIYHVEFDDYNRGLIHEGDIPVFVPMSFSKAKYLTGSLFNILWNKAVSYLRAADEINFIGYGFPSSDVDYLELFLSHKDKVRDIVIFDARSQNRVERIFENARVLNLHAGEYLKQEMYK